MANMHHQPDGGGGNNTVAMLGGTPIQISGITGSVIMKQEPHEGGGGTISLTPVSLSGGGQVREGARARARWWGCMGGLRIRLTFDRLRIQKIRI